MQREFTYFTFFTFLKSAFKVARWPLSRVPDICHWMLGDLNLAAKLKVFLLERRLRRWERKLTRLFLASRRPFLPASRRRQRRRRRLPSHWVKHIGLSHALDTILFFWNFILTSFNVSRVCIFHLQNQTIILNVTLLHFLLIFLN